MTNPKDKQAAEEYHYPSIPYKATKEWIEHQRKVEYAAFLAGVEFERKRTAGLVSWMEANVPEMECRGDDDCDHCLAVQFILEYEESK